MCGPSVSHNTLSNIKYYSSLVIYKFYFQKSRFGYKITTTVGWLVGWLVVLSINVEIFLNPVDLAIFQPYLDLEAGDNQSLKIQVARPGMEPRSSCSASQELNHLATTAPDNHFGKTGRHSEQPFSHTEVLIKNERLILRS